MKEQLSFKNIFKRETKLASYIIICMTVVVISLSYAMFFRVEGDSTNQEIVAGNFTFTYENGTQITSTENANCFLPVSADEASLMTSECDYQFSVQNKGTLKATYTLKLTAQSDNTMDSSKLKVILRKQVGNTLETVVGYPKSISELTDGVLITEQMDVNAIEVYTIQIYVDETNFVDSDISKVASYKINGIGLVDEEEPLSISTIEEQNMAQLDTSGASLTKKEEKMSYYYRENLTNNYIKMVGI